MGVRARGRRRKQGEFSALARESIYIVILCRPCPRRLPQEPGGRRGGVPEESIGKYAGRRLGRLRTPRASAWPQRSHLEQIGLLVVCHGAHHGARAAVC